MTDESGSTSPEPEEAAARLAKELPEGAATTPPLPRNADGTRRYPNDADPGVGQTKGLRSYSGWTRGPALGG
ncbi:hypothetical protein [Kribbella solani]|uniref:hypothetical protein n=1 Tax=Kribbella solani TaxID=236067 RepID=UPI0029BEAF68|nr:hypothetical protein [Kribbella solani]MDX2968289.1 hypothetical protein [Kribbella solani]